MTCNVDFIGLGVMGYPMAGYISKAGHNITVFNRRSPDESDISELSSIDKIYDYRRMLDAEGYPNAFMIKNNIKTEFSKAKIEDDQLVSKVKIKLIIYNI